MRLYKAVDVTGCHYYVAARTIREATKHVVEFLQKKFPDNDYMKQLGWVASVKLVAQPDNWVGTSS